MPELLSLHPYNDSVAAASYPSPSHRQAQWQHMDVFSPKKVPSKTSGLLEIRWIGMKLRRPWDFPLPSSKCRTNCTIPTRTQWQVLLLHRLAATPRQETLAPQIPVTETESHGATDTSIETMATMGRIRQSMPDSATPNPVSGRSRSKETTRDRPV